MSNVYHVKRATPRGLRYKFSEGEAPPASGEEVEIIRRKRVIARLLPPRQAGPRKRPDYMRRLRQIYGDKARGVTGAELLSEERNRG